LGDRQVFSTSFARIFDGLRFKQMAGRLITLFYLFPAEYWTYLGGTMGASQNRGIQSYRTRLSERGVARFEVLARNNDRDLIRSFARHLAEDGPEANQLRAIVGQRLSGSSSNKGGILAALRRSPMAGREIEVIRSCDEARHIDI
jgi:hypothetical protein